MFFRMFDEVFVAFEQIVGAGKDGEDEGEIEGDVAEDGKEIKVDDEVKQQDYEGGHLNGGFEFAVKGSSDGLASAGSHHAHAIHGEIANQDNRKDPKRNHAEIGEDEKGEVDKHFVGERVQESAEVGNLLALAGPVAVDFVGDGGNDKNDEGGDARPSVG